MTMVLDSVAGTEVSLSTALHFPCGLPGLEEYTRFTLVGTEGLPVYWLECDEEPAIALPVVDAFTLVPEYAIELGDADAAELSVSRPEDAAVLVVLNVAPATNTVTANLLAPIIVGRESGVARQIILDGSGYSLRHAVESL